jgi:predicted RNA-binding protein with RPS1 domain
VKRYSPELQKRSAEQGHSKEQEFDDYVKKLKEWSKSDKSSTSVERTVL